MGYYANGSGGAKLKDGISEDVVIKVIDNMDLGDFEIDVYGGNRIDIVEIAYRWEEEDTMDVLNTLIPFISEGMVCYTGEDDYHWRYTFDPENNEWIEEEGTLDYNFESYSDKQLIEELVKRGYRVSKNRCRVANG
jgi:hypothetical protein